MKNKNLENTYNLNTQKRDKEKYDLQQAYNSLASEIKNKKLISYFFTKSKYAKSKCEK
jgi:hypothetical protein